MNIITRILNGIHASFLLIPFVIFFLDKQRFHPYVKWLFLIIVLTPLHWVFFKNRCVFTIMSKWFGDYEQGETTSEFSEYNMKWIYLPIMKKIGWQWNSEDLDKMVTLHWIMNIIIVWYYVFFVSYA